MVIFKLLTTVLYMKSSGFYALIFRIITDFKFIKFIFVKALKPLFFIYVLSLKSIKLDINQKEQKRELRLIYTVKL
ncbi:hypothetical protein APS56_01200 [Pseudalgibacter alginicilyticus]|uniref:Uncharacterized protein n=1 Tax=Pseudalgibacter alginicilyticus TaxID=1736674 RepID=A0A0P0CZX8_9FLAO|nr:hypothetical protein APS56_01200 [Pseudalgibacter alginicilyticus]